MKKGLIRGLFYEGWSLGRDRFMICPGHIGKDERRVLGCNIPRDGGYGQNL